MKEKKVSIICATALKYDYYNNRYTLNMNIILEVINKYLSLSLHIKATLWFLICLFLQKGISFIATPVFTRIMSPSEFGAYNVWISWFGVATVIVSLNLFCGVYTSGIIKFSNDRKTYSQSLVSLNLVLCISWLLLYLIFDNYFNALLGCSNIQMLCMIFLIWTSSIYSFWASEQRVDLKYKQMVCVTLLLSISKPIVCFFLVINFSDKVTARIVGVLITEAVICTPLILHYISKEQRFFNLKYWKYALFFNIPLVPHYLSQVIITNSDRIMISYFDSDKSAGIYSLGASVAQVVSVFCTAFFMSIEPWLYRKLKNGEIENLSTVAYTTFSIIGILNLMLIIMAPEAVKIFAPFEYHDAIWIVPPLACGIFFSFQYTYYAVFEFYYKKTHLIAIATFVGTFLNLIGNYLFIPVYGYQVAAYTSLLCYMVYALMHYIFMRSLCVKNYKVNVYSFKVILILSFSFIILSAMFMLCYPYEILRYVLFIVISISVIMKRGKIYKFKEIALSRFTS